MNLVKDSAIVIQGADLGESDRLITFLTSRRGRLRAVAKGARRSRKRFLNALEPCTLLRIATAPSRREGGLSRLDSAEIVNNYPGIRSSATRFMLACLCCELACLWVQEEENENRAFSLMRWYLDSISTSPFPMRETLVFKTRLLAIAGYRQSWDRCSACGGPPRGTGIRYSIEQGGFRCAKCAGRGASAHVTVSAGTLRYLALMDTSKLDAMPRIRMSEATSAEAWNLLSALHCHHLQRTPRSYSAMPAELRGYAAPRSAAQSG